MNYWDDLMGDPISASMYMQSYGEGVGSDTRFTIAEYIEDGESLLDVGCGPGWNYEHFKEHGPDVIYKGTDYSQYMIEGAKTKYPEANFEVGDARTIEEKDDSWDVVILQDILEHTNGYEKPLKEAVRVATKRVIVTFWRLREGSETETNDDGNDGWGSAYNKKQWEDFLDTLGYRWVYLRSEPEANRVHDFYIIYMGAL